MASFRRDLLLLAALCAVALLAVGSDSHGLQEEFGQGKTEATPEMASFFGAKPEAAVLPEALPAKPEAASAMPTTTNTNTDAAATSSDRKSVV